MSDGYSTDDIRANYLRGLDDRAQHEEGIAFDKWLATITGLPPMRISEADLDGLEGCAQSGWDIGPDDAIDLIADIRRLRGIPSPTDAKQ